MAKSYRIAQIVPSSNVITETELLAVRRTLPSGACA